MVKLGIAVFLIALALITRDLVAEGVSDGLASSVDHLVYASPDMNRGVAEIEAILGVRPVPGGQHLGLGTRNALIALGAETYLEVFAPDPEQPTPSQPRPYGLDNLKASRLVAWFVKGHNLEQLRTAAIRKGVPLGEIKPGGRKQDGIQLSWRFTDPWSPVADEIVPRFINWGTSPHPAHNAPKGALLVSLRAEHPDVKHVQRMLHQVGVGLPVVRGPKPALIAVIDSLRGRVELRSDK